MKKKENGFNEFKFEGKNNFFEGRLYPKNDKGYYPLSIKINGLAIHGAKLICSDKGDFVALPTYKSSDGEYKPLVHFVTKEDVDDLKELAKYLLSL